uniref:Uncharacterized protein n=1 Tax=Anguilla anguilla TaxID=7936 RepID=A0A0E9UDS4_ANGAN
MIRVTGGGGGYPSMHWARGRNTPWNKSPIHRRAPTHHSLAHSHIYGKFRLSNLANLC